MAELNIKAKYSTSYIHKPKGLVERAIRTIEIYIKTFLVEENALKKAVNRAIKVVRFSWSARTKKIGLNCFEPETKNEINKHIRFREQSEGPRGDCLRCLREPPALIQYTAKHLRDMAKKRKFGRTAGTAELQPEIRERKVSTDRFFEVRNWNKKISNEPNQTKTSCLSILFLTGEKSFLRRA